MKTYLRSLQLRGFKSFNKPTYVEFMPGLNCIVGPNGSGKSVEYNTLVLLSDGSLKKIGDLVEKELKKGITKKMDDGIFALGSGSLKVISLNKTSGRLEEKPIAAFIRREGEKLFEIETRLGKKIKATGCHPVIVFRDGEIKSSLVRDLKEGDLIATPRLVKLKGKYSVFKSNGFETPINKDFARFLGYLIGDGYIARNRIEFINEDPALVKDFIRLGKKFTNKTHYHKRKKGASFRIIFYSTNFVQHIFSLYRKRRFSRALTSNYKSVPKEILVAPNNVVAHFLAALFDCDGSVHKTTPAFEFTGKNELLVNQVQTLLLRFGIIARKKKKIRFATNTLNQKRRIYYSLYIEGKENLSKLLNQIPFRLKHKLKRLKRAVMSKAIPNPNIDVLPRDTNLLIKNLCKLILLPYKPLRKKYPALAAYIENRCHPARNSLLNIIPLFEMRIAEMRKIYNSLVMEQEQLILALDRMHISRQSASLAIGLSRGAINNSWVYYRSRAKPHNLKKFYLFLKKEIKERIELACEILDKLRMLATSDVFWDKIVSIKKTKKPKFVYDLAIPENHNFIGNGIIIHNSNLLDALCFVLGRLSTKSIRAENYADLLHKKKGESVPVGEVILRLDNSAQIFPVESKLLELRRKVNKQGQTVFYINGKRATRQQAIELLSLSKITPEGHNIILQGDIDKFISMSQIDKRRVIEEVAGIYIYEQKKEAALRELSKVEEKLKEARIVLTEKQAYMDSLEEEKKQAERFLSFDNELKAAKATELRLRITALNKKRAELAQKFSKIESTHNKLRRELAQREKKIEILNEKISKIEDKIGRKGGEEQLELQRKIENLKIAIENSKNLITSSKNDINRINQRKKGLEEQLQKISKELEAKEREKSKLEKERRALLSKKESITKEVSSAAKSLDDLEKELVDKEKEIENLKQKREQATEQLQKISANIKILEYKLEGVEEKISEIEAQKQKIKEIKKSKERYKKLIQEINQLTNEEARLTEEIANLRKLIVEKEDLLGRLRSEINSAQEIIMRDRAVSVIMKSKKRLGGILGTVAELGRANSKFALALGVAAGTKMKNIVVENEDVAIKALSLLKQTKSGVATFLPLNKIRSVHSSNLVSSVLNREGVYGLASELIECEPKYKPIFRHIFRDTLIIKDTNVAKALGIGKFSMVTLDGDVFSVSGAITGGFRRGALSFAQADRSRELEQIGSELLKLKNQLKKLEKEKIELANKVIALRGEKAELEGKIGVIKEIQEPNELFNKKSKLIEELKALNSEKSHLEKNISRLEEQINKELVRKNSLSIKIKELKFGKKSQELKEIESKISVIDSKLQALTTSIENVLKPEQENIKKVITSLEKERADFERQIKLEEELIQKNQQILNQKEKEEREFYGELKALFNEKNKLAEFLKKEEEALKELRTKLTEDDEEKNALSIAKAKVDAQFAALQEELEPYKEFKTLPYLKNPTQAKQRQEELHKKIEELGTVNMRALEIYDKAKKEFDQVSWRVEKLTSEKEAILNVINEIEHKKKESFMNTFNGIRTNFERIFSRISERMRAQLLLENSEQPFDGGLYIRVFKEGHDKPLYLGALSGGEKTLVALAFIFAIQEHNPAPFYLLDEIDAALDKVNSEKVAALLQEYSKRAQIIIISHNDAVISAADNLYGVWMNQQGESYVNALKI